MKNKNYTKGYSKGKKFGIIAEAMIGRSKEGHSVGIGTPFYMAPE